MDALELFLRFIRESSSVGRALRAAAERDRLELAAQWADEAAEAAIAGNPERAAHIEYMTWRVLG